MLDAAEMPKCRTPYVLRLLSKVNTIPAQLFRNFRKGISGQNTTARPRPRLQVSCIRCPALVLPTIYFLEYKRPLTVASAEHALFGADVRRPESKLGIYRYNRQYLLKKTSRGVLISLPSTVSPPSPAQAHAPTKFNSCAGSMADSVLPWLSQPTGKVRRRLSLDRG
jgi:hypothetical protein